MNINRIIIGCWQLAGGHGSANVDKRVSDLIQAFDQGFRTFDCADIYTGVEELLGEFLRRLTNSRGAEAANSVRIHTKCVPDLGALSPNCGKIVEQTVHRSAQRLGRQHLDLVQFHWWDYSSPGALEALATLNSLKRAGLIREIGLTNFDTAHTRQFVESGIPIFSTQVQYSVLDERPVSRLVPYCLEQKIRIFCYGSLAGGLVSEKYLGLVEPLEPYENRSLVKYKLVVDDIGGWDLFQEVLSTLKTIGQRYELTISETAMLYILQQPGVSALIVGHRSADHLMSLGRALQHSLPYSDISKLKQLLSQRRRLPGDVYDAERDRNGPHGRIMRYNLNSEPPN